MPNCPSCGSETNGTDRFCRNCGAPLTTSTVDPAVDSIDTSRFNPAHSSTANPLSGELTSPFYAPPSAVVHGSAPLYQTAPVSKNLFRPKFFWLLILVLLSLLMTAGIGFYFLEPGRLARSQAGEQVEAEDAEIARRLFEGSVQNALGFKQGNFSESEFPDVKGIFINSLMSDDSPAALAGIQAGDVLMELNSQAVRNNSELAQVLDSLRAGDEAAMKLYRDGATVSSRIKIADRSFPPIMPKVEPRDQGYLGIKDSSRRCCLPSTTKWGVEVHEIYDNTPADIFGLRPGDVITEFNGRVIKTPSEFNRLIRAVNPRRKVMVKFYRGNTEQKVEMIIGHRWG